METLLEMLKRRKFQYFGHHMRSEIGHTRTLMIGLMEGNRARGRPQREWSDDLKELSGRGVGELMKMAGERDFWRSNEHKWVRLGYGNDE